MIAGWFAEIGRMPIRDAFWDDEVPEVAVRESGIAAWVMIVVVPVVAAIVISVAIIVG